MSRNVRDNVIYKAWVTPGCITSLWLMTMAIAAAATPTLSGTQSLSFGKFAAGSGGSVTVSPGGGRNAGGNVVLLSSGPGAPAQFTVSGTASSVYVITLPANGTVFLTKSGATSMSLTQFTSTPSGTGLLNGAGQQTVSVGATLNVGAAATAGAYTGAFDVTVDYP